MVFAHRHNGSVIRLSHEIPMRVTDSTIHKGGSVDFIVDDRFMLQLGEDGQFSIPAALNAYWRDEDAQDDAADTLDAEDVAEQSGAAAIARAADLLRKVEAYASNDDDFASGGGAYGTDFWGVGDVPATDRHNPHSYISAQRVAHRGLCDEHTAIAFRIAGIEIPDDCDAGPSPR
jgi:hypothetical protein